MSLTWRPRSTSRWIGTDDRGRQVGFVGLAISEGGATRWWHGWRRDGTPTGIALGRFTTAEAAMAAVDEAGRRAITRRRDDP